MKLYEIAREDTEKSDLIINTMIVKYFKESMGLEVLECGSAFPFDIGFMAHTIDRSFIGILTHSGTRIKKGSIYEDR